MAAGGPGVPPTASPAPVIWFAAALLLVAVLAGATATVAGFGIGSLLTPLLVAEVGAGAADIDAAVERPAILARAAMLRVDQGEISAPRIR